MTNSLSLLSEVSLDTMLAKAEIFIKSGLVPKAFNKPEAVLVACTYGAELGFSAMQSLQTINVIEGKPCLSAAALQALAIKNGGSIEVVEHTDRVCELSIKRGDKSHTARFSVEDASKQGLLGKANWVKMPKAMLYARATSMGIRAVFADVIAGLYTVEELEDGKETFSAPAKAPKAAKEPEPTPVVAEVMEVVETPAAVGEPLDWDEDGDSLLAFYKDVTGNTVVTTQKLKDFCNAKGIKTIEEFKAQVEAKRKKE